MCCHSGFQEFPRLCSKNPQVEVKIPKLIKQMSNKVTQQGLSNNFACTLKPEWCRLCIITITGVNAAGDAGDTSPPIFWLAGTSINGNIPTNIITYFRVQQTNVSCPHPITAFHGVFYSLFCSKIQNLPQNQPKPHWGPRLRAHDKEKL